jgi:hypothetical protein
MHERVRSRLLQVRSSLGEPGVTDRVAARILEFYKS